MTASELLELIRAGYTREEIDALASSADPAPADPAPDPATADPAPEPAAPEQPEQPDVAAAITAALAPVLKQIGDLTRAVQASNAAGARSPEPAGVTIESVVSDFFSGPAKGGAK